MFTQQEINKLPKWAQNKAKALISNDAHNNLNLPVTSRVTFEISENNKITCFIDKGSLSIHANSDSNSTFVIAPEMSNGIKLFFLKK